jgi:hypothetical protein
LIRLLVASVFLLSSTVQAAPILVEGFDDVSSLVGWTQLNQSAPLGTTGWFQGNPAVFVSESGADDSYIAANFNNADTGGNISNWLITPIVTLADGDTITFYTRATGAFQDRLEVRLNPSATTNVGVDDTTVGDFTVLLLTVNPALDSSYPTDWFQYTINVSGLGVPTNATIGFRYFVPDTNTNGEYIGIDTLQIDGVEIPEPATFSLIGTALALLVLRRSR